MTLIDSFMIGLGVKPDLSGVDKFKSGVMDAVRSVRDITLAFQGVYAVVSKVSGFFNGMINDLDSLSDAANLAGVSVSELDKIQFIATQTDSSAEAAKSALLSISRAAGQAANGMKESQEAFDKLGVKIKDSNGKIKESSTLFYEISDALKGMDKAQQLAYARKFRLDPTIITTMTSDIASLRNEYDAFADAAGIDLGMATNAASDFADEMGKFGKLSQMIMRSVMTGFIVKMKDGFLAMRKWLLEHADTVKKVIQSILSFVGRVSEFLSSTFSRFGMIFARLADWWDTLDDKTKSLALAGIGLIAAWKPISAFLMWLTTPIGMVVGAVTALFLIWDDLMTYLEGGISYFDWGPWIGDIEEAAATVEEIWEDLKAFAAWVWERLDFTGIFDGFKTQLVGVKDAVLGAFGFLKGLFTGDEDAINEGLRKALGGLVSIAEGVGKQLLGVFSNIVKLIGDAFGVDLSGVVTVVEQIFNDIVSTARTIIEPAANVIKGIIDTISALFRGDLSGAVEAAGSVVRNNFEAIKSVILGALNVIRDFVNFVLSGLGIDATGVFNALKAVAETVFGAIGVAINAVTDTIKNLIGWAKDAWNWLEKLAGADKTPEEVEAETMHIPKDKREALKEAGYEFDDKGNVTKEGSPEQVEAYLAKKRTETTANVGVESPAIVTEGTRAGTTTANNTNIEQNNNVKNDVVITVNGAGDPEDVAERTSAKLNDATRYTPSAISSSPEWGGAA